MPTVEGMTSTWVPAYGLWHRRWRARRADLLEAAAVGSVVLVVSLFLARGGAAGLGSPAGLLIAAGQVTGLVATDLILIQLLLAARLPWVDRVYGMDRGLKAHRVLGRITVPLLVVHAGALILGYAAQDHRSLLTGWPAETWSMLGGVPDMLTAYASLALLIVVAVTSVRLARARLGYERWHLVHLTAYAAVVLAIPHELSDGSDIAGHPVARAYWLALYLLTAGSVAWWRFAVPLVRTLRHRPYVERVVPEAPGVWSVWIRGRHLDRIGAQPGQYFTWRFVRRGLFLSGHPWSLSAPPGPTRLRITVRDLGDHSRRMSDLRPGTRVVIEGPYGSFTAERRTRRRVALVAAGIGITPVRALAEELSQEWHSRPGEVTVLYRADHPEQLALAAELDELARRTGLVLHFLIGPPVEGSWLPAEITHGRPDHLALASLLPDPARHDVFVCGPQRWMDLVHHSLRAAGVPRRRIHDERFSW
jgi:predicted ferric reductase